MNYTMYILIFVTSIFMQLSCQADKHVESKDSPFEYREIYLPESDTDIADKLHLNDLDIDWGLWGHKISNVLPADHSQTVYATVASNLIHEQYCFTSHKLYEYVESYIDDNFDENHPTRFAILPNDNDVVCQCSECLACGNTEFDASPAVFQLIGKLSDRFPRHQFFTSFYRTTRQLPKSHMPENAGVLISTMGFPLSAVETPRDSLFKSLITKWSKMCNHIYVWDYINNFDDYFTPFPLFDIMQRRLQIYAQSGVDGVFLNGSGTDYSSFSPLRTHILALLLQDPDTDWREALKELCSKHYPKTGNIIANYIIDQEDYITSCGKILPIYDGIASAVKTYLPTGRFISFFDSLQTIKDLPRAWEKTHTEKLLAALSFTRLELMRLDGNITGAQPLLQALAMLPEDESVDIYSESCWTIENYIHDYKFMMRHAAETDNLLRGKAIKALTALDEDYADPSILTDGLLGLPSNYHCGQMLSSATPALRLAVPVVNGMHRLRLCFTRNTLYKIQLPTRVTLRVNGQDVASVTPKSLADEGGHSFVEFDLPQRANGSVEVIITRDPEYRTMALDEIEGL